MDTDGLGLIIFILVLTSTCKEAVAKGQEKIR
jgi:hypothetical protein